MSQNPSLRIETLQPFKVTGILTKFKNALHDEYDGMVKIPAVWQLLTEKADQVENNSPGFAYGVMLGEEDGFTQYVAGFSTNADFLCPPGFIELAIPSGLWAIFTHRGSLDNLQASNVYAYEEWLPNSGYQMRMSPHIEFYSPKSEGPETDMEMEFWIPIEESSR